MCSHGVVLAEMLYNIPLFLLDDADLQYRTSITTCLLNQQT